MKKLNFKVIVSLALAIALLSGCASIKTMKKKANLLTWEVKPTVLEAHNDQVQMAIEGKIPAKYFAKKASITATPVLKYDGGEVAYPAVKLQGEKVKANNPIIAYKIGGNFSVKGAVPYVDSMRIANLEIRIVASKGLATLDFDPIKVADATIATSTLVDKVGAPIIGVVKKKNTTGKYDPTIDAFQRIVPDEFIADINYLINSAKVRPEEIKSDDVSKFTTYAVDAKANSRKKLNKLEVSAYSSPDGKQDYNEKLSKERSETATNLLQDDMKKAQLEAEISKKYTAEDWEGFKELMEKSSIQDKELILRVLSMYSDPEVREKEIRNLSAAFTSVADQILPQLRRSKLIANIDLIGRTDEELLQIAENKPEDLNQAELLYAATLTKDLNKKLKFYTSFTKQFSDDWRGFNNLGMVYVLMNDVDKAGPNFEKAEKLDPKNPIIQNNLGLVPLFAKDANKAKEFFAAASGLGKEVDYNMGIISIYRAEYDKAVKYFGECVKPNAALAKILAGDNNGALKTLESNDSGEAMVDYLKAVVGARTAKTNLIFDSLASAVKKNASMKTLAKTDMEFAKYFADPKFKAIVE